MDLQQPLTYLNTLRTLNGLPPLKARRGSPPALDDAIAQQEDTAAAHGHPWVTTFTSRTGHSIHLTPAQVRHLDTTHSWPLDPAGRPYTHVTFGLHIGQPTLLATDPTRALALGLQPA